MSKIERLQKEYDKAEAAYKKLPTTINQEIWTKAQKKLGKAEAVIKFGL